MEPNAPACPGPRIVVVGVTGSGKTTTATRLASILNVPHIELDSLYWQKDWVPVEKDLFRQQVDQALSGPSWVTDGNYSIARSILWGRASTLVWLDYDLPVILWQLFQRTISRVFRREVLWNKNRETFRGVFFSRDSLFLFAFTSHKKHHLEYPRLLAQPEFSHLQVIRFNSREETNRWLNELAKEGGIRASR